MRTAVTIALAIFMLAMPALVVTWTRTPGAVAMLAGLEAFCALVLVGFWAPPPIARVAWRCFGGAVFLAYAAYLAAMLVKSGGRVTLGASKGSASVLNAIGGLVVFGLPGLRYALLGRLGSKGEEEAAHHADRVEDLEDEAP